MAEFDPGAVEGILEWECVGTVFEGMLKNAMAECLDVDVVDGIEFSCSVCLGLDAVQDSLCKCDPSLCKIWGVRFV